MTARVTLFEGRYHQLRRMFGALGNRVDRIHRESIGPIRVDHIRAGAWRLLTDAELDLLAQKREKTPPAARQ